MGKLEQIYVADFGWSSIDDSRQSLIRIDYVAMYIDNREASRGVGKPFANWSVRCHGIEELPTKIWRITERRPFG